MPDRILLHATRDYVDKRYVGFKPNGGSIKPVHVAGGSLRCIFGALNTSMAIKRLALVSDAKGNTPAGNDTAAVHKELLKAERLDEDIDESSLESLRNVIQKLLSSDKGVYPKKGLKDGMISYSAGSKFFLTGRAMYEDIGEFIGDLINSYCPELSAHIKKLLEQATDPISLLFEPVLEEDSMAVWSSGSKHEELPAFKEANEKTNWYIDGLRASGNCLLKNLQSHSNPLTQLRLFNFFCIFHLVRYMTMLESFYCGGAIRPILMDFSGIAPSRSSVARASEMSYTQMYKSINRFYSWGYSKWLNEQGYSKDELLASETPVYKEKSGDSNEELNTLWQLAKERAATVSEDDAHLIFGETIYDMLALEASSHPVHYLKILGTSSGILYPPDKLHPNKRFVPSQDMLEMLLRSCVTPNEIISSADIRERLWEYFGIIIGGGSFEMEKLNESGMILQIDEDALEDNFSSFASTLEAMDFAEVMADGILQIRLGGAGE